MRGEKRFMKNLQSEATQKFAIFGISDLIVFSFFGQPSASLAIMRKIRWALAESRKFQGYRAPPSPCSLIRIPVPWLSTKHGHEREGVWVGQMQGQEQKKAHDGTFFFFFFKT